MVQIDKIKNRKELFVFGSSWAANEDENSCLSCVFAECIRRSSQFVVLISLSGGQNDD